ncbi:hypothetical protein [Halocalculus aciditolerans]|uniref:DUF8107 domain-containing protein n=1 Tax=Halocalculus aciditolerans TaxID=1383812 RepID=A0A830FLX7_9EURY|nr:hypothetical protein [Halocalculus aciditolerans]GGL68686.1 hypothetical protein GCM10009039_28350 [Halocalculus aciditolerans]
MAQSGDRRVHFLLNLVLSTIYATVVVYGADYAGYWTFTPENVVGVAALIFIITYLVIYR